MASNGTHGTSLAKLSLAGLRLPTRPRLVLDEMLSLAQQRLQPQWLATLDEFERQLFKLPGQAVAGEGHNRHFALVRELRRLRGELNQRFLARLESGMAAAVQGQRPSELPLPAAVAPQGALPGVVAALSFDDAQVGRQEARFEAHLCAMGLRFGVLVGAPGLDRVEVPLGPRELCASLRHAFADLVLDDDERGLLLSVFERLLLQPLDRFYLELETLCQRLRVLPHIERRAVEIARADALLRRTAAPENVSAAAPAALAAVPAVAASAAATVVATDPVPPSPQATGGPLQGWPLPVYLPWTDDAATADDGQRWLALRTALAERRHCQGVAAADDEATCAALPEHVQSVLAALQKRPVTPLMKGGKLVQRGVAQIKQDLLNQLRPLATDGRLPRLGDHEADVLELHGLLFEQLCVGQRAESTLQRWLANLQVPLLRAALRDPRVITHPAHPARQFLNAVCETAALWLDEDQEDPELVGSLQALIDRAVAEYDTDVDLFRQLFEQLLRTLSAIARKAEVGERRHVDACRGREKLEAARQQASSVIAALLAEGPTTELVRTLLAHAWADALALTLLRVGPEHPAYLRRLEIARCICRELGADSAVREHPMSRLDSAADLRCEVDSALTQVGYHAEDVAAVCRFLFGPESPFAPPAPDAGQLMASIGQHSRLGSPVEPGAAGHAPVVGAAAADAALQEALERLCALPIGIWIEFQQPPRGDRVRRKLIWFSRRSGSGILLSQRGARSAEKSLIELASEIQRGSARILDGGSSTLIDRAWSAAQRTLEAGGGIVGAKPAVGSIHE